MSKKISQFNQQRVNQFCADKIIELANRMIGLREDHIKMREHFGFAQNPAYEIDDLIAKRLLGIAKSLLEFK